MPSIFKLKNGKWRGQVVVGYNPNGGARYKTVESERKGDCKSKLRDLEKKLSLGVDVSNRQSLGDYLEQWIKDRVALRVKPTTLESYQLHIRCHLKLLAGIRLQELNPPIIQRWINDLVTGGRSPRTVQYSHCILRSALSQGVKWGYLERNPALAVDLPRVPKFRPVPYDPDECRKFLAAIQHERLSALYVMALFTGLRLGEMLALRWEDLDLDNSIANVRHTLVRLKDVGFVLQSPKTDGSERVQDLPDTVVAALRGHWERQIEEKDGRDYWNNRNHVFVTKQGSPMDSSNVGNIFRATLEKHTLRRIRFHDLRHTAASLAIHSGASVKAVSNMLGHSNANTTLQVYSHVFRSASKDLAKRMDAILAVASAEDLVPTEPGEGEEISEARK